MSTISLTNFDPQIAAAQQQQKLAQLLQQQAAEPLMSTGSGGGIPAPISPLAGLAKLLNAYAGIKKEKDATAKQEDIAQQQQQQRMDAITKLTAPRQSEPGFTATADSAPFTANIQPAGNGGLLEALKGRLGMGQPAPAPMAQGAPSGAGAMGPMPPPLELPTGGVSPLPDPQTVTAANPTRAGDTPLPDAAASLHAEMAPNPVPRLEHNTTPEERQQMALQAMTAGDPTLAAIGSHFFSKGEADQTKLDDRAKITAAVAKMPFSDEQKAIIGQLGELGGADAAMKGVEAFLKPADQTEMTKNFHEAQRQGFAGTFMDYVAFANPKITVMGQGTEAYNTRDLANPGGSGGPQAPQGDPAAIGQQISTTVLKAVPGAVVTSVARTPDHNAAVGGVGNSYHLGGAAVDFTPPKGMPLLELAQNIRKTLPPGFQVIAEKDHVHVEPGPSMGVGHGGSPKPVASVAPRPVSAGGGAWAMTPQEQAVLNQAVGEGRIDLKGLNSRTAKIAAAALVANPGLNAVQLHAVAQVTGNPAFQQRAKALEALPESLKLVMDAGSKLNFSSLKPVGDAQAWVKEQTNDPDFRNYMGKRNDALQRLAYAMRGVGMSDNAVNLELQSAPKAMSPPAFKAWYDGQIEMVNNQLANQAVFQVVGSGAKPAPSGPPQGVHAKIWAHMTPQEKALWR